MDNKLVAVSAAMAAVLYLLAAGVAWYRFLSPTYTRPALKLVLDRAIAWSALAVIFSRFILVRLGVMDWGDDRLDFLLIISLFATWACGLTSVRAFTLVRFGSRVWMMFGLLSLGAGVSTFFW